MPVIDVLENGVVVARQLPDVATWGEYRKHATVRAYPMDRPFIVATREGEMRGYPGDLLCCGADGEFWPIQRAIFEKTYHAVDQAVRKAVEVVYIAGPMSVGDLMGHVRTACRVATILTRLGYAPIVPQLSVLWHLVEPREHHEWLETDVKFVERCDAMIRLPGASRGADQEEAHARTVGVPVYHGLTPFFAAEGIDAFALGITIPEHVEWDAA